MYEVTLILYYCAFTSLTTVGLGDYAPKSNIERVVISAALLFGVAVFSYIMGNFVDILNDFKNFDSDLDQGDELSKFFGVLKKFNGGREIDISFKQELEQFFAYKWTCDRNFPFVDAEFENIVGQVPDDLTSDVYVMFLFSKFL